MANAIKYAERIIKKWSISNPAEFDLEGLVFAEGAYYEEKSIKGAEGRTISINNKSYIIINSNIKYNRKKRFVIAHEIGHYLMHKKLSALYNCDQKAFYEWHKKGSHETEANEFAAEFLMPYNLFKQECTNKKFSINIIENLSNRFNTSFTSTSIRYAKYGNIPVSVVFAKDNKIKWSQSNTKMPYQFIPYHQPVPDKSIASFFFNNKPLPDVPKVILPNVWFTDNFMHKDIYFYEQCFPLNDFNSIISFIWECKEFV